MARPEEGDIIAHCGHFYDAVGPDPDRLHWLWDDDGPMFALKTSKDVTIVGELKEDVEL